MKTIPQRELRNRSGAILRSAEKGLRFVITVDGRPVALLGPYRRGQWVSKMEYLHVLEARGDDPTFFDDIAEMPGAGLDLGRR
jgi:prevent-host-death family protein